MKKDNVEKVKGNETDFLKGIVVKDIVALNVRNLPSLEGDIVTIVYPGFEILVDVHNSTEEFYKVVVSMGDMPQMEGYCVKEFINISE